MLIKLTTHALFRLQERGFSVDNVRSVIKNCRKIQKLEEDLFKVVGKVGDKGTLTVIYKKPILKTKKDYYLIITAYFTNN